MSKAFFEALRSLNVAPALQRRRVRAFAKRAIWAALQHREIGIGCLDLEKLVNDAVEIAEKTSSQSRAIDMAQALDGEDKRQEETARAKAIRECKGCQRARDRVGYPGMPSSYRYCEAHR